MQWKIKRSKGGNGSKKRTKKKEEGRRKFARLGLCQRRRQKFAQFSLEFFILVKMLPSQIWKTDWIEPGEERKTVLVEIRKVTFS